MPESALVGGGGEIPKKNKESKSKKNQKNFLKKLIKKLIKKFKQKLGGADTPRPRSRPPRSRHPPEQTPPRSRHPPRSRPPWEQTPPSVNRMADRCKNITLATTSLRSVIIGWRTALRNWSPPEKSWIRH